MKSNFRVFLTSLLLFTLFSCGGGSLSADTSNPDPDPDLSMTIALIVTNAQGETSSTLSGDTPLTVTATVTNSAGALLSGQLVSFSLDKPELALFNNDAGSALTGSDPALGVATIGLLVGQNSGAGLVIATLEGGETAQIGFVSSGIVDPEPPQMTISMSITDTDGVATNELSTSTSLIVSATVSSPAGDLLGDQLVTFSFDSALDLASFNNDSSTGLTGTTGETLGIASIGLIVGANSGDGNVIATLATGESKQIGFTSIGSSNTAEQPFTLELFASGSQLASSGSDQIDLFAVVKNEQNVLLENILVIFSANSGASITASQPTTDASGIARVLLGTGNKPENRSIIVTAEIVSQNVIEAQNIEIAVVGTQIVVDGPSSIIVDDPAPITIIVSDSDSNGIANQAVTLSVFDQDDVLVENPTLSDVEFITDNNGQLRVDYQGEQSGQFRILAQALNAQGSISIIVQQDKFGFDNLPDSNDANDDIALGLPQQITISWLKDGVAFAGGAVSFNASRGAISSADAVTDVNGNASFTISADNAGFAAISALGTDSQGNEVSARGVIAFVATVADTIRVDATPDSIGPDGQSSTITAVVRDPTGNLVKSKQVNFLLDDVSGGDLSLIQSSTDRSGIATTVYRSNAVSTIDSVKVTATVDDTPAVTSFTTLTVGDRGFDITVGTGRLIASPTDSSYTKEFSAFVLDPDSNPVAGAQLTFSAPPVKFNEGGVYRKGYWQWDPINEVWFPVVTVICANEDINGDGILDEGEDTNGDGNLTPGLIVAVTENKVTDVNGQALISMSYPQLFGAWVDVMLEVSGQSAGSEVSENQRYTLGVAASDLSEEGAPPPPNPYGAGLTGLDANPPMLPDGSTSVQLCRDRS